MRVVSLEQELEEAAHKISEQEKSVEEQKYHINELGKVKEQLMESQTRLNNTIL